MLLWHLFGCQDYKIKHQKFQVQPQAMAEVARTVTVYGGQYKLKVRTEQMTAENLQIMFGMDNLPKVLYCIDDDQSISPVLLTQGTYFDVVPGAVYAHGLSCAKTVAEQLDKGSMSGWTIFPAPVEVHTGAGAAKVTVDLSAQVPVNATMVKLTLDTRFGNAGRSQGVEAQVTSEQDGTVRGRITIRAQAYGQVAYNDITKTDTLPLFGGDRAVFFKGIPQDLPNSHAKLFVEGYYVPSN
eukprot:m.66149 g.66149  ORF g.66149 m.66149 type:complete len:240 (-) comp12103_c0_seq4:152-871(-)